MTLIGWAWIIGHVNQFQIFVEQLFKIHPFLMGIGGLWEILILYQDLYGSSYKISLLISMSGTYWISWYIYSRHLNDWCLVFFIMLYPYFTHKGLIFILEVKFQCFLVEPTHMSDLSSEEFDLSAKEMGNWILFPKNMIFTFFTSLRP